MKNNKLYNIFFPIWLLVWIWPLAWIIIIPLNFLWDLFILWISFKKNQVETSTIKKVILRTWLMGFVSDFIGAILMYMILFLPFQSDAWYDFTYALFYDPFSNILSFITITLCVILTGCIIYFFNSKFCLKKANLTKEQLHKTALNLAIFTAPYLLYLPSIWFYK